MSDMKLIMERWNKFKLHEVQYGDQAGAAGIEQDVKQAAGQAAAAKAQGKAIELQTVGDLKKLVAQAVHAKKKGNTKDAALAVVAGIITAPLGPGKDLIDLARAAYSLPDEKKLQPGLAQLNVDDEVSAIVDDKLENAFLKTLSKELSSGGIPDDTPLQKLDMTKMLSNFIAKRHDKRTITVP
jgi:hypothetical protein